jgi:serine protease AprX
MDFFRYSLAGLSWPGQIPLATVLSSPSRAAAALLVEPNPARDKAVVRYSMTRSGRAELALYDVIGRTVKTLVDDDVSSGAHEVSLDVHGLARGVYILKLSAGASVSISKLVLE